MYICHVLSISGGHYGKGENLERLVAEIPMELKRKAAAKAALEGRSLKAALIELLEKYVEEPAEIKLAT